METREQRIFQAKEIRAERDDDGIRVSGFAAVYGVYSGDLGGFRERIRKGAFAPALKRSDVRFLLNHEGLPLARFRGIDKDTLTLEDRDEGLWFETRLAPDDPDVQRLVPKLERGDLDQMSFAFSLPGDGSGEEWTDDDGEAVRAWHGPNRDIVEFNEAFDISPVTFPAYEDTSVALRSLTRHTIEQTKATSVELLKLRHDLRLRLSRN